ncbi:MAG: radical SAM protein [candidate division WOR-3 bacterium]|nr:radical SAM protein [candidate division WOR-3 bacterium]
MSALSTNPKILITTAYMRDKRDCFDSATVNIPRFPRFSWPTRAMSYACRFIKQNIPEIEVMEFPSWQEYVTRLREGWDVVGFTGFNYELVELEEMAEEARRQGIREIWSGSYMALSPEAEAFSDKVWVGYAEDRLAAVYGRKIERIKHPPAILTIRIDLAPHVSFHYKTIGGIFTQRGCAHRCTFCQTPYYCPHPYRLPIESIEEVLRYYHRIGIDEVSIGDENFGQFREHSDRVVELLQRYGMRWWVDSRAELISRSLDDWVSRGLALTVYGVESVRASALEKMNKVYYATNCVSCWPSSRTAGLSSSLGCLIIDNF